MNLPMDLLVSLDVLSVTSMAADVCPKAPPGMDERDVYGASFRGVLDRRWASELASVPGWSLPGPPGLEALLARAAGGLCWRRARRVSVACGRGGP